MKTAILAPVYLSMSWVLTISYQLFTDTAVKTISQNVSSFMPAVSIWLINNLTTVSFVYAFSWIFILSSVLPSLILGKERSVIVQYLMSMVLTVLALSTANLLPKYGGIQVAPIFNLAVFLHNEYLAIVYLVIPYAVMIVLDVRLSRVKAARRREKIIPDNETSMDILPKTDTITRSREAASSVQCKQLHQGASLFLVPNLLLKGSTTSPTTSAIGMATTATSTIPSTTEINRLET